MRSDVPHPKIPAMPIAPTMAHGTAVAAFEASSLMCTLESNEPSISRQPITSSRAGTTLTDGPQRSEETQNEGKAIRPPVRCKDGNQHPRNDAFQCYLLLEK